MKKYYSHIIFCLALIISLLCPTVQAADGTSFDPTKVEVKAKGVSSIPVGTIISWPVAQNPADFQNTDGTYNWLECNGQSFDATVYPELFAVVGPTVPDLQGLFLRGYGSQTYAQVNGTAVGLTSTMHTSGPLGQVQGDAARNIYGRWAAGTGGSLFYVAVPSNSGAAELAGGTANTGMLMSGVHTAYSDGRYDWAINSSRTTPVAPEDRPVNMAVRYLMRSLP